MSSYYCICVGSVLSFSVLVQAITFITFGAMADYSSLRKTGLTLCTCIGCFSALLVLYMCFTCALSCFTPALLYGSLRKKRASRPATLRY